MNRTKTIFLAFTGNPITQKDKVLAIKDGYECWDLKQFTLDEFVEKIQQKIPPINDTVKRNYKLAESRDLFGITEKQFEKVSWGLLIPDTIEEGIFNYAETIFLLNLYSPNFLYPLCYVNDMGITRPEHEKNYFDYFHTQTASFFQTEAFVNFYKLLLVQTKYGSWNLDRIQHWDKEDWRLFSASFLYYGLKDYENSKTSFGWQRESAEMATILEALFTAGDSQNQEVVYRLRKRVAVLLSERFPTIEDEIKKDLYKARCDFVHGSFFAQIAKDSPKAHNNIPTPDFNLLYKHKEYVRFALVGYLNLARMVKAGEFGNVKTAMDLLESAIMDVKLREQIRIETKRLFDMLPTTF